MVSGNLSLYMVASLSTHKRAGAFGGCEVPLLHWVTQGRWDQAPCYFKYHSCCLVVITNALLVRCHLVELGGFA